MHGDLLVNIAFGNIFVWGYFGPGIFVGDILGRGHFGSSDILVWGHFCWGRYCEDIFVGTFCR